MDYLGTCVGFPGGPRRLGPLICRVIRRPRVVPVLRFRFDDHTSRASLGAISLTARLAGFIGLSQLESVVNIRRSPNQNGEAS